MYSEALTDLNFDFTLGVLSYFCESPFLTPVVEGTGSIMWSPSTKGSPGSLSEDFGRNVYVSMSDSFPGMVGWDPCTRKGSRTDPPLQGLRFDLPRSLQGERSPRSPSIMMKDVFLVQYKRMFEKMCFSS